jgi:hypothetical protein
MWEGVDWIHQARDREWCLAITSTALKCSSLVEGLLLASQEGLPLLHGVQLVQSDQILKTEKQDTFTNDV